MATVLERLQRVERNRPKSSVPGKLRRAQARLARSVAEAKRALEARAPAR